MLPALFGAAKDLHARAGVADHWISRGRCSRAGLASMVLDDVVRAG